MRKIDALNSNIIIETAYEVDKVVELFKQAADQAEELGNKELFRLYSATADALEEARETIDDIATDFVKTVKEEGIELPS